MRSALRRGNGNGGWHFNRNTNLLRVLISSREAANETASLHIVYDKNYKNNNKNNINNNN